MATKTPMGTRRVAPDLRRAIPRHMWLANRARNALRRPVFVGAISIATFVTAIVSMVVVPRAQRDGPAEIPVKPRPDTLSLTGTIALAQVRFASADSSLAAARAENALQAQASVAAFDTLSRAEIAREDSLHNRISDLERLLEKAEQAPLPSSYRALADHPAVRSDPRTPALVDSLADVERDRDAVGAAGGVDPIFVALTTRANEIGRSLQAIGNQQRTALLSELSAIEPVAPVAVEAVADTAEFIAQRDSLNNVLRESNAELARRREAARALDLEEARERDRATAIAPPLALLAAAFVLSAFVGYAAGFVGEIRKPRVSDAVELERYLGVRVLSTIETSMPTLDRGRRRADQDAPPYFDPGSEGYQLAYLGLATEHPTVLMTTITGDDPAIAAVVACNLAAIAVDEARSTLVLDTEPSCSASGVLRTRVQPGVHELANGRSAWPDVRLAAEVGRDKTVDLIPYGDPASRLSPEQLSDLMRRENDRLARYYDAIVLVTSGEALAAGLPQALLSPDIVYCAQPGTTPLRQLREQLDAIRAAGGSLRGIVLWSAERPLLPTPRELTDRPRGGRKTTRETATAAAS